MQLFPSADFAISLHRINNKSQPRTRLYAEFFESSQWIIKPVGWSWRPPRPLWLVLNSHAIFSPPAPIPTHTPPPLAKPAPLWTGYHAQDANPIWTSGQVTWLSSQPLNQREVDETYFRFCRLQSGRLRASHRNFTPSSPRLFFRRFRCVKLLFWRRASDKYLQLGAPSWQDQSLWGQNRRHRCSGEQPKVIPLLPGHPRGLPRPESRTCRVSVHTYPFSVQFCAMRTPRMC